MVRKARQDSIRRCDNRCIAKVLQECLDCWVLRVLRQRCHSMSTKKPLHTVAIFRRREPARKSMPSPAEAGGHERLGEQVGRSLGSQLSMCAPRTYSVQSRVYEQE